MENSIIYLLGFPTPQPIPAAQASCSSLQPGLSQRTRQVTTSMTGTLALSWGLQKEMKASPLQHFHLFQIYEGTVLTAQLYTSHILFHK